MSTAKRITDFLPAKECQTTKIVQAHISEDLHSAVREQIAKDQADGIPVDMKSLLTAALRAYLTERGAKRIP